MQDYVVANGFPFAILTNYRQWVFCQYCAASQSVSRTRVVMFNSTSPAPSVYQCMSYFCDYCLKQSTTQAALFTSLSLSYLGSGRCGVVLRGQMNRQDVALKAVDLWHDASLYRAIKNEIEVYSKLHDLQGVSMLKLVWTGFLGTRLFGMATSFVGTPLPDRLTRGIKKNAFPCSSSHTR